jgi:hypothetical protein
MDGPDAGRGVLQLLSTRTYRPTTKCIAVSVETCSFTL